MQKLATSGTAQLHLQHLQPRPSKESALEHLAKVFDASEVISAGHRPFMESVDLFEPWHSRIRKRGALTALEIKDVRTFCLEIVALQEALAKATSPWAQATLAFLMKAEEPLSAIDQILTPRGEIRSDASETLFRLFREKENLSRQIQATLDRLVNDQQMQNYLQDKYVTTREGRWVLPIRSGSQHSIEGVIHGSSQTKQTVFMEPEAIIPVNNRLRQVEVEIEDEIERLLVQLSEYLANLADDFAKAKEVLVETDELLAQAQWSILMEGHRFEFVDNELFLVEVKHPVLQVSGKNPVANTVHLSERKSLLLLSGPNAGGKTVLLKAIGLAAQMARCGLPICAGEGSRLPFFERILVGIGDSQSVGAELSTFAAHLKILEEATQWKGLFHLVLIDEICGSTDPEEGSALARAFLERFSHNRIFGVVTSHLGPLKSGWSEDDHILNGSLEYDLKAGRPTYQFIQGIPGDSLAIQTARRVGVPRELIERATEFLSPSSRHRLTAMNQIDQMKADLHLLQESLRQEQNKAASEKSKYEKLREQFEKEKENILEKVVRQAEKQIQELIAQAKADQTFKRHSALQEIKNQFPEIVKRSTGSTAGGAGSSTAPASAEDFAKRFPPGSKVFVPHLNQDGLVQSTPNSKGEILILSNSIRVSVPWHELKPPVQAPNPTANLVRRSSSVTVALQESDRTLDLRGLTVEEAISRLEMDLDQAAVTQEDRIKIIHGHGTEALKKAVRTYLSRSIYVKKWKAGSPEQGGDGITWVELSDEARQEGSGK
ncbi:MAG: endonuclease MutS2 [Bdellovibrio sp.]|nr:MAG: endonuclease MutS2 [Bdellovibrio sp.]